MGFLDQAKDLSAVVNNPYGTLAHDEWDLTEGSFTSDKTGAKATFLYAIAKNPNRYAKAAIDNIQDTGGRRQVKYEYPYRDGQAVADLGRRGETYSFQIVFYGKQYSELFNNFLRVCLNTGGPGVLSHPVRGNLKCNFESYDFIHNHGMFQAVQIKAVFTENNRGAISAVSEKRVVSQNSAIRDALGTLSDAQKKVQTNIDTITRTLDLPKNTETLIRNRLGQVVNSSSGLIGKIAATFSTDQQIKGLAAQSAASNVPISSLSSGITESGTVPAVYQTGLSVEQSNIVNAQTTAFTQANQITPQQAVFLTNQTRSQISAGIKELEAAGGNDASDGIQAYRDLAVQLQNTTDAAISTSAARSKNYKLPYAMSIRKVAFLNGLSAQRADDILQLNSEIKSVNWIAKGTVLAVPVQ